MPRVLIALLTAALTIGQMPPAMAAPPATLTLSAPPATPLVVAVGGATHFGDPASLALQGPLVGLAPTPSGAGYWLAGADGGVFAYGDAPWLGSIPQVLPPGVRLAEPIVDIVATASRGFWMFASDGGVFAYGDAPWLGSIPGVLPIGVKLAAPIVAAAATPSGNGYWLLGADGGVFTFGDAGYYGSVPEVSPGQPADAVAIVASQTGLGYVIHDRSGTNVSFGDASILPTDDGPLADVESRFGSTLTANVRGAVTGLADLTVDPESGIAAVALSASGGGWVVRNGVGATVAVWQSGGLSSASRVAALDAATRAGAQSTVSHGGTIDYVATWRNGSVVDAAPSGWRIAMSAIALNPAEADPLLGGPSARSLERGEVVVGTRAAARHNIHRGDVIELFGWNGRTLWLTVGHIGESVEIGNIEVAMSTSTAAALGFSRPTAVIMWAFDSVVLDLQLQQLPPDQRWLTVNRSWVSSGRDSVLSTAVLKDYAGEPAYLPGGRGDAVTFQQSWIDEHIVAVDLPILGSLRCHRAIADQLVAVFTEIEAQGLGGLIDVSDTRTNGGCFFPRTIRGASGGSLSRHSWGVAIDVNPRSNPFGSTPTMDTRIVDIFRAHGFAWGGTWVRADGMHFEWTGPEL